MKTFAVISLFCAGGLTASPESGASPVASRDEKVVVVGGQVRRPGPVPYTEGARLYDVIQRAGGATEFGSMRRVKVIRNGESKTYDLTKDDQKMVEVLPDDTIEVPQKNLFGR